MRSIVVIPCYHLVWYNIIKRYEGCRLVVIPCYHLVWYNFKKRYQSEAML
ncbi:hypothetical protein ROSINTL182_05403 [Roseburia intestinalis L1-82]|uniref:Uncharacterized protein n=1 Tax=Roseburia intestinalis L1-82 TaxID=536231 RepID=C7G691_9FIRM|nr:hypothetical protein ROSINTL182_05403 [Roseburia intestinalis L1-82]